MLWFPVRRRPTPHGVSIPDQEFQGASPPGVALPILWPKRSDPDQQWLTNPIVREQFGYHRRNTGGGARLVVRKVRGGKAVGMVPPPAPVSSGSVYTVTAVNGQPPTP